MQNRNVPSQEELPSKGKLFRSTLLAMGMAAVILVTVVLPAEYGVDPLGVGNLIGLTRMGQIKSSLAQEAADEGRHPDPILPLGQGSTEQIASESAVGLNSDSLTLTLQPNEGREIKLAMSKGASVTYVWFTDGGKANFDSHADSEELQIKYHNYEKGQLQRSQGQLVAAFNGKHGWFWRNRTAEPMTVTLQVSGEYSKIDLPS